MLQPPKHASFRKSTGYPGSLAHSAHHASSPTSLPPSSTYSGAPSVGRNGNALAASPSRPSMFNVPRSMESSIDRVADLPAGDFAELFHHDKSWWTKDIGLINERTGRSAHQRESSLTSTLGSTGPNSPCSPNISTPHIAATDSIEETFRDSQAASPWNYHFSADSVPPQQDQYLYTSPQIYGLQMGNPSAKLAYSMNSYVGDQQVAPPKSPRTIRSSVRRERIVGASYLEPKQEPPAQPSAYLSPINSAARRHGKPSKSAGISRYRSLLGYESLAMPDVPKLDRTMTDVYDDGLYSPNLDIISSATSPSPNPRAQASSEHDILARGLSGASVPPHSAHDGGANTGYGAIHNPQQARDRVDDSSEGRDRTMQNANAFGSPQTISPQDSILEYSESNCGSNHFPLFGRPESSRFSGVDHLADDEVALAQCENEQSRYSLIDEDVITIPHYIPSGAPDVYNTHSFPPFTSQQNFPAAIHVGNHGSGDVAVTAPSLRRNDLDDGGTYSCTYHGCVLRFETPALLQKHKREGHRQAGGLKPSQRGAKVNVMDTQAGPHRCYRVNPGTGKVCRAVFSRPYDLTRHEDTIHNARKQKVRCDLCTEEKLFSRADALTRHYRVCHPDVEVPGKHRRRRNVAQE
jgi:hypothetical protein